VATKSPPKRDTFRHGNLPEALVNAALERLEAEGVRSISLRELARDAGVNHRAVYRHFPDKLSLLALVAETGWKRLGRRLKKSTAGKAGRTRSHCGQCRTFPVCAGLSEFISSDGWSADQYRGQISNLDAAVADDLQIFAVGFAGTGMAPIVIDRTAVFVSALQGVITQILHGRLRVPPAKAKAFVADVCRMLIKGTR
jgi:AcrR family transcriptional regulator